jgi:putative endonuclease
MMSNRSNSVIYTGVTSNLSTRVTQHKNKSYPGFTSRYNCNKLVYFQEFTNILDAIAFEKKIKAGNRAAKEKLISEMNPNWDDLSLDWIQGSGLF